MACHSFSLGLTILLCLLVLFSVVEVKGFSLIIRRESEFGSDGDVVARSRRNINNNNNAVPAPATIVSMNIDSKTSSRYTQVQIESVVANDQLESREAKFVVQIPESAFISNFSMLINDTWLLGQVMEKTAADKIYEDAQSAGQSAGHVGADNRVTPPRGMDNFVVSINVAAQSEVQFKLLYSELLERRLGLYRQRISIRPGQIVNQLSLRAELFEPQGFESFKFSPPGESTLLESSRVPDISFTASNTFKTIEYDMSVADQSNLNSLTGSDGEFIIEYDVTRKDVETTGGLLIIDEGYFVHYIAPTDPNLVTLDKNVAFIIDVSGSMSGPKIVQTRQALNTILSQLRPTDYFNLLLFESEVHPWQASGPITGTAENINAAKQFVDEKVKANGGTNIDAALRQGGTSLSLVQTDSNENRAKMIVFLTDGMPSAGVTDTNEIRRNVRTWNSDFRIPIFSLGFGEGVSFDFLSQLSYENYGFSRKIYEGTDGASQLSNFFAEIESVTVVEVEVTYDVNAVAESSLTSTSFPQYFKGTELIVAGEINPSGPESWTAQVTGNGKSAPVTYDVPVSAQNTYNSNLAPWSAGFAEKLRAYLKIKDLIRDMSIASDENEKAALKQAAIDLSLHYNFVTPVTSMVVTQSSPRQDDGGMGFMDAQGKNYPGLAGNAILASRSSTGVLVTCTLCTSWFVVILMSSVNTWI